MPNPSPTKPAEPAPDPSYPWTNAVAVTAAVLAAMAAVSSLFSTRHTTEAMIDQIEASDGWNFFQAKSLKSELLSLKGELAPGLGKAGSEDDVKRAERYAKEKEDIKKDAEAKQQSARDHRAKAAKFANAATCSQIAIALTAISLLTKKPVFWWLAIAGLGAGAFFVIRGVM